MFAVALESAAGLSHRYVQRDCLVTPDRPCVFPPFVPEERARYFHHDVSGMLHYPASGVRGYVGIGVGAGTIRTPPERAIYRRGTRLTWHARVGVEFPLGRRALVLDVRREAMTNPPFGDQALTDLQLRCSFALPLRRGRP